MIPAPFDYEVATSVDHAASLLAGGGDDASLLAGGHSLLPLMRLRLARPALLVDIGRLDELRYIREDGDAVAIGALTRHHDLAGSPILAESCGIVAGAAGQIGDPQVRHRGTIGGSIAHADPASDMPAVLLALGAELVATGPGGSRSIAASDFFVGPFISALEPDEVLTEIRVPKLGGETGSAYLKFNRRAQDWAIVGVAAVVERENGSIRQAAIGLTNMGGVPVRATAVEQALSGADPAGGAVSSAAAHAADGTEPPRDTHASSEYRAHLARVLVRRAVEAALAS